MRLISSGGFGSRRLLWQYFLSYLAVMIVVMALLLVFAYRSFRSLHERILLDNYTNALSLICETNETELSRLVTMAGQFTSSPNVSPFIFSEEPEKAVRLISQLSVYQASNNFIRGMYLMFINDEYIFSASSSYLVNNFVNKAAVFDDLDANALLDMLENTKRLTVLPEQDVNGYVLMATPGSKRVIPALVPVVYSSGARCGTVLFLIDKQTYTDMFERMSLHGKNVYIFSGETPIISSSPNDIPLDSVLSGSVEGYKVITLLGQSLQFRYVLLVPNDELTLAMADSMKALTLLAAAAAALGILLITRFVQSRIKPIRLLYNMLSDRPPGGSELIEIRDGVQRLLDDNAALTKRMESAESLHKADFARRFLQSAFEDADVFLAAAESIKVNVDTRFYAVAIFAKPAGSDYEATADKLNQLFDETVSGVSLPLFGRNEKQALLAFANDEVAIFEWFEAKFAGIRVCCVGATMAASAAHSDYREGSRAYLEAEHAFETRFVRGNGHVLRFDAQMNSGSVQRESAEQTLERLRLALRAMDAERITAALADISRLMRETQASLFAFRCLYNDILAIITTIARELNAQDPELYDLFTLSQCLSLGDLDVILHSACSRLIQSGVAGSGHDESLVSPPMIHALEIIGRRFSEPGLSVSSIAVELGMSDSRLSIEFKKAYGLTPLESLTQHRMRRARRLLRETAMPVKDIAVECGYYEISGFNRRFKAYTGATPQQYRRGGEESSE